MIPFSRPGFGRRAGPIALALGLIAFSSFLVPGSGIAQLIEGPAAQGEATPAEPATPKDEFGRDSPRGLMLGLLGAMAAEDHVGGARYLDLGGVPEDQRARRGPELARALQQILDRSGQVIRELSDEPAGDLNDGLPPEQERLATVRTPWGVDDLLAERVTDPAGHQIWLVSAATVGRMPGLLRNLEVGLLDRILPESLAGGIRVGGVPLAHWVALLATAVVAYLAAWAVTAAATLAFYRFRSPTRSQWSARLFDAAILPLRIYLAVSLFAIGGIYLGVSIVARQQFGYLAEIVAWVAIALFFWRFVDAIGEISGERMSRRNRLGALSALRFFRRTAKFVIVAIAVMAALGTLGFDVTAGLAALGIGGIAIALGAQKTIENLVGSLTVIADQPVRVGEVCRFGETIGTVEDVGMRSTRIRTLDRTVVTVPNGEFAALQIENYSRRDRFWFHPILALRYETTPDQIRYLLVRLRELLASHPRVDPDPARVRFLSLGADSLNIEIFAYVHAPDYAGFLEIQEALMLRIMDLVAESGTAFAFPSRTLYMARDAAPPEDKRAAAEARVREWLESGEPQPDGGLAAR